VTSEEGRTNRIDVLEGDSIMARISLIPSYSSFKSRCISNHVEPDQEPKAADPNSDPSNV
jgi:hypothetical protein